MFFVFLIAYCAHCWCSPFVSYAKMHFKAWTVCVPVVPPTSQLAFSSEQGEMLSHAKRLACSWFQCPEPRPLRPKTHPLLLVHCPDTRRPSHTPTHWFRFSLALHWASSFLWKWLCFSCELTFAVPEWQGWKFQRKERTAKKKKNRKKRGCFKCWVEEFGYYWKGVKRSFMSLSQAMRKPLSCLKQLGGIWVSPASAVLPGLTLITEAFLWEKKESHGWSVLRPHDP